jgi:ATP-dependent Lon protease
MAFAVTAYKAYGMPVVEPLDEKFIQCFEMTYTRGAADVDADIGDSAGTFWTAAGGTTLGAAAKAALLSILPRVGALKSCELTGDAEYMLRASAAGASAYVLSTPATPTITHANNGTNTTIKLVMAWTLNPSDMPVRAGF